MQCLDDIEIDRPFLFITYSLQWMVELWCVDADDLNYCCFSMEPHGKHLLIEADRPTAKLSPSGPYQDPENYRIHPNIWSCNLTMIY